ncbi:MAG: DNA mismatch repair endonuclease MutL, partial [Promethearchaeota archaeon]
MKRSKIKKIVDAEKIAAGEVVERPVNIVKELIENSIDAGAREIRVIIKKAGKSLIQIIDNGIGIPPDEIDIAFERHTSSKIVNFEDLEQLSTLGFRGEALASIAVVSQVEIVSRIKEKERGIKLVLREGKIVEKEEVFCPIGTDIKVKNLFYNIPARLKFLKKDPTELGHITDIIQRYALAYPQLHFIYMHNNLSILNCPASNDLKTTVFHIYGKRIASLMESINHKEDNFNLHGLMGHSETSKNNRTHSSFILNKRYVISDLIFRAVQEGYKGTLMIGRFPFFVLNLEINPSLIDFNVHPKKLNIRFENEEYIYNKVYNIVRSFIEEKFIEKEDTYTYSEISKFSKPYLNEEREKLYDKSKLPSYVDKINTEAPSISKAENDELEKKIQLNLTNGDIANGTSELSPIDSLLRGNYIEMKNFPKLRLISRTGQLSNKTYVILEGINENNEGGFYVLDQHAASERINKEFFYDLYENSVKKKQKLISPLKIELSPSEKFFLESNIKEITKLGFDFEHFGGNSFVLRAIPIIMGKTPNMHLIKEIISDITDIGKDRSFSDKLEEIINYLACHKSIRGGDDLSLQSIRKLII